MKNTICLNMIVKNETKNIKRLFKSLYDEIDYYVIHDTGSTDGTPEFIKKMMNSYIFLVKYFMKNGKILVITDKKL